jgi:hypothetical protein
MKAELELEIRFHLKNRGSSEWTRVRERYPHVSKTTFFRIAKRVRRQLEHEDQFKTGCDNRTTACGDADHERAKDFRFTTFGFSA